MTANRYLQLMTDLVDEASCELFGAYGVTLAKHDRGEKDRFLVELIAAAGLSGPGIRATCVLASSKQPIAQSMPIDGSLRDWIAELMNQLVGRVKNKLLARGAEVYITTPVVVSGEFMDSHPRLVAPPLHYSIEGGDVFAWMDAEIDPEFMLGEPSEPLAEGEALLF